MRIFRAFSVLRRSLFLLIALCCVWSFVLKMLIVDTRSAEPNEPSLWHGVPAFVMARYAAVKTDRNHYVSVAAYYDDRPNTGNPSVRILGYHRTPRYNGRTVYCRVQLDTGQHVCLPSPATLARVDSTKAHGNSTLSFYLCHLQLSQRPVSISIMLSSSCKAGSEIGSVAVNLTSTDVSSGFGVCLSNIARLENTDPQTLVEFIELNTLMGMHVLYMYTSSVRDNARDAYLGWYERHGRLVIVDWRSHVQSLGERDAGTLALNDCLYRRMRTHSHLVFSDLNQLVAPDTQNSWRLLLSDLTAIHNSSRVGAYIFRAFRYFDETGAPRRRPNTTLTSTSPAHRLPRIVTHRVRERQSHRAARDSGAVIVEPMAVLGVTSLRVLRMLPGRRFYSVPPIYGCVHVYPPSARLSARELVHAFLDPSLDKFVPSLLEVMHQRFYSTRKIKLHIY